MICDRWRRGQECYYCLEGYRCRRAYPGHRGYRHSAPKKGESISAMIKRNSGGQGGPNGRPCSRDVVLEADHPLLMEYLTQTAFEDGSERETATLLIFAAEGVWKICLNDRAEDQALWASGSDVASAMEALERMLDTAAPDWRRTAKRPGRK